MEEAANSLDKKEVPKSEENLSRYIYLKRKRTPNLSCFIFGSF